MGSKGEEFGRILPPRGTSGERIPPNIIPRFEPLKLGGTSSASPTLSMSRPRGTRPSESTGSWRGLGRGASNSALTGLCKQNGPPFPGPLLLRREEREKPPHLLLDELHEDAVKPPIALVIAVGHGQRLLLEQTPSPENPFRGEQIPNVQNLPEARLDRVLFHRESGPLGRLRQELQ